MSEQLVSGVNDQRLSMFKVESTPNPNSLKFTMRFDLIGDEMWECDSDESANQSPLAESIWKINQDYPGTIARVFLHENMIVVSKAGDITWDLLQNKIESAINNYIMTGLPVLYGSMNQGESNDRETISLIAEVMKNYIQPALAQHGGFATLKSFTNGIVEISMHGACNGCPSSDETMSFGISSILKLYIPGIKEVNLV